MAVAVTGEHCNVSSKRMVSPGTGTTVGVSGNGKRLRASAFACSFPGL